MDEIASATPALGEGRAPAANVGGLPCGKHSLPGTARCLELERMFVEAPDLGAVIVHRSDDEPAVLTRARFFANFTGRLGYRHAIRLRRSVQELPLPQALILPSTTSVADAAAALLRRPLEERWEDLVVRFGDGSVGTVSAAELFAELAYTHAFNSQHDGLTGLANRRLLLDRLDQALARQTRSGGALAVLSVDLDDFKSINDGLGHELGDEVLLRVGERLSSAVRREDAVARVGGLESAPDLAPTVARLGGDQFVVLAEGLAGPADVTGIAARILAELRTPLVVGEQRLFLDASVGITLGDAAQGRVPVELLRNADIAMYAAKQAGKGRCEIFEEEMHRQVLARTALIRDLRGAVSEGQLLLLYQPQIELPSGRMVGVEALVRWEHPERGLLSPDRFIPLAESTGLIVDIDDWVVREACTQMRAWDQAGLASLHVGVNISAHRLVSGDLAGTLAEVLRDTAADPARLEIELTETVAVEPDSAAVHAIGRVRELGVQVAIDDFGMGHSALSRLQTFPVDRLKIDKSFVAPLAYGSESGSIAAAMVAMARSLGLLVVAEGVEIEEQLAALMSLGCECAQGYLFSKPVPVAQISQLAQDGAAFICDRAARLAAAPPSKANGGSAELVHSLLSELQRLTGLDTTYLTRVDGARKAQQITHARNTAMLDIPEGLTVDWSGTLCRRALEQGISYTDDVPRTFPDSEAAAALGLQTYVTVPLLKADGDLEGTLCGASRNRVALGPETVRVMESFAALITQADRQKAASTASVA